MTFTKPFAALGIVFGLATTAAAQQPPSFAKQVRPLLARYCLECHNAKESKGDLNLETFAALMKGGNMKIRELHGKERVLRAVRTIQTNPHLQRMRELANGLFVDSSSRSA